MGPEYWRAELEAELDAELDRIGQKVYDEGRTMRQRVRIRPVPQFEGQVLVRDDVGIGLDGGPVHPTMYREFVLEGNLQVEVEDLEDYVQVKFITGGRPTSRSYTYRDPFGDLEVGDLVQVPTRFGPTNIAEVVALGRQAGYSGRIHDVSAKFLKQSAEGGE